MTKRQDALDYHSTGRPGKIAVVPTKPLTNQRDLSLAYSPGVAEPCLEIERDPDLAYTYTAKGNLVGVVTNGTAVLGLGNIGALAGKPVMEGKANLFKTFADLDVFDLEVGSENPDDVIKFCQLLEPTVGGINLEDIRAPDCFYIEETLRKTLKIPVFHDDQHGTAIISGAALLNALECVGKDIHDIKVVFSGAGAAAISTAEHYVRLGVARKNIILCDRAGVIYNGRVADIDPYKARFSSDTEARSLAEALVGADVFVGLSVAGAVTGDMIRGMASHPIIFALANPVPEILPEEVRAVRDDAIIATGRSDYANQVNNVLGFPFIFRGALDVRATEINEEMKMAATRALALLAKENVPDSVARLYGLREVRFGPEYLIPFPFDPRVLLWVAPAVAWAAIASGASNDFVDLDDYRQQLESRLGRARGVMRGLINRAISNPKRIVFPEGDEPKIIRAARICVEDGIAFPTLLGNREAIELRARAMNVSLEDIEIEDPATSHKRDEYAQYMWARRQRKGMSLEEARRRPLQQQLLWHVHGGSRRLRRAAVRREHALSGNGATGARGDRIAPQSRSGERHVHARVREAGDLLRRHDREHRSDGGAARADWLRGKPHLADDDGRRAAHCVSLVLEFRVGAPSRGGENGARGGTASPTRSVARRRRRDASRYSVRP
jgi:malate dehydrogenase (oxaloacetate-decarboxylating)(NADP+)